MSETVIVALIACAGTLFGSLFGVLASAKLTGYRLEQLERRVEKHNHLVERMTAVEASAKSAHHRLDGMEKEVYHG
jgi:hypothetical protein